MDHPNPKTNAAAVGYGTDPNLITPAVPWRNTLSAREKQMIGVLSDVILPARAGFPQPSQMGISAFMDQWLSAPYVTQQQDRSLVLTGLKAVEADSIGRFGVTFDALSDRDKCLVVDAFASNSSDGSPGSRRDFFVRFRYLVLGGYFTSGIGFKAIGYLGNVPLSTFPPVNDELRHTIDHELVQLGLKPFRGFAVPFE
jgi:hypothetical protein